MTEGSPSTANNPNVGKTLCTGVLGSAFAHGRRPAYSPTRPYSNPYDKLQSRQWSLLHFHFLLADAAQARIKFETIFGHPNLAPINSGHATRVVVLQHKLAVIKIKAGILPQRYDTNDHIGLAAIARA